MQQMLSGGVYNLLSASAAGYSFIIGDHDWTNLEENVWGIISSAGTIKNLRVKLNDSPGAGKEYAFTLMLNGNPTSLTLTISDAETQDANTANSVAVVAGDSVYLRCIPSGTPTARYATWTSIFEGTTANESIIMGGSSYSSLPTTTRYARVMTGRSVFDSSESGMVSICPASGTIKNLYIKLNADPGTSPDAYRFTIIKNGAAQTLTATITADDTTGNDTANSFSVSPGDTLTIRVEALNTPTVQPKAKWGMTFVADTDGESIILSGRSEDLDDTLTEFQRPISQASLTTTESERYQLGQACTLKKLYIKLDGSPGSGNNYTFTLRIAGADSNVVTTISGAATTGNSGALEDTVADDEYITWKVVPTSLPTARRIYWGFVSLIEPPSLAAPGGSPLAQMIQAGLV